MKMNKAVAAVAAGMIAFGAMFSVSAAGIGYVNSNALLAAHPKMQKAQLDMRAAAQKAEESFKSRSAGKTDQEKQQIATELQKEMDQKEKSTMQPILSDIMKAIQQVRQEKGLDIILEQGAVVDGGVDVTSAVAQKLSK
ncbi:OmpH family outer membrane protein [uncultured Dialister sp.]|jgi:outer membrane protein|uniref:OmpH family outer membrane protein n=1 Tax=uncultured Dialister sp. TaxID=278064 RepID=UPI0025F6709A|nr:OmpH family outer membrane protein [uncultured Dialister sp.]